MASVLDFYFTDRLGRGTYGVVFKATNKKTHEIIAIKRISKKTLCKRAQDNLVDEIGILKELRHRNIALMTDFSWDSNYVYIFMEYLGGGDLSSFLKSKPKLPEKIIRYFLQQLAFALHYLYVKNIVHMDIKPQNILLTASTPPVLKLADFGFAKSLEEPVKMNEIRGSLLYVAPEIYKFGVYEKSCDLWSVGVILFECLFGKAPFASATIDELKAKLVNDSSIKIPTQCAFSKDCVDLVSKLLKRKPSERIRHEQFFTHPFIDLVHAPSPQSLDKAIDHIMIADELYTTGGLFDAYFNYKEGLFHLVSALQIEPDPWRRRVIRTKVSHYINVAEDLNRRLDELEADNYGHNRHKHSDQSNTTDNVRVRGATPPTAKPPGKPDPISMAIGRDKFEQAQSSNGLDSSPNGTFITPSFVPPVASLYNASDARRQKGEENPQSSTFSSAVGLSRQVKVVVEWFSCLSSTKDKGSSASIPTPNLAQTLDNTESSSQPDVKTVHECTIERLNVLRENSSKENVSLLDIITGLQCYYTSLNNNEYKAAMDYLQCNFSSWLNVLKGLDNLDIKKTFRIELNEALRVAENLKAALKVKGEILAPPEEESNDQGCLIS